MQRLTEAVWAVLTRDANRWSERRTTRSNLTLLCALVGVLAPMLCDSRASADVEPVEHRFVAVARDGAALRCREGDISYAVAKLKAGQVLSVTGESDKWLRVLYPYGARAVVKASEVTRDPGRPGVLTLNTSSALRAANTSGGGSNHWWRLLDEKMEPGTELSLLEPIKRDDGTVVEYYIRPPFHATAYLRAELVREATTSEVESYLATVPEAFARLMQPKAAVPDVPAAAAAGEGEGALAGDFTGAGNAAGTGAEVPTTIDDAAEAGAVKAGEAVVQGEPATMPTTEGPTPTVPTTEGPMPGAGEDVTSTTTTVVQGVASGEPTLELQEPERRALASVDSLTSLFDDVMSQPIERAELDAAISEFDRVLSSLGDSGFDQGIRSFLERRKRMLGLRIEMRDSLNRVRTTSARHDQVRRTIREEIRRLDSDRWYDMIGRVVPSTVYDGDRLPLMYRVQVVDAEVTRTAGYIIPNDDLDMTLYIDRVVGVKGPVSFDRDLGVRLIKPSSIDVIRRMPGQPALSGVPNAGYVSGEPGRIEAEGTPVTIEPEPIIMARPRQPISDSTAIVEISPQE